MKKNQASLGALKERHCCRQSFRGTIVTKNTLLQGGPGMAQLEIRITAAAQKHITQNGGAVQLVETRDSRLG